MGWKENKAIYNKKYSQENTKKILLVFNKNTEPDIIDYLALVPNVSGFIKELIREKMKEGK